jgi:peroxiredoxin
MLLVPPELNLGQVVPDWNLPDVRGRKYSLGQSLGPSGAVLTFIRGMFCPYCTEQLHQLREGVVRFVERGVSPIVIAAYGPEALAVQAALEDRIPILIDSDRRVIDAYGLRHDLINYAELDYPTGALVHPTTAVLDAERRLRWLHVGANYADRPKLQTVLAQVDLLKAAPQPAD